MGLQILSSDCYSSFASSNAAATFDRCVAIDFFANGWEVAANKAYRSPIDDYFSADGIMERCRGVRPELSTAAGLRKLNPLFLYCAQVMSKEG